VRRRSWKGWRRVRRQAQLDPGFTDELVAAVAGGDRLRECIQCGACSAVCPLSAYMEYTPRRLIAMTRAGMKEDVLRSTSIWVCASCYACTAVCPKEIPITELVYALKRMSVREKMHPRRFATPILAREFEGSVDRFGRNTESRLAIRLYLRTRPTLLLKDGWLAQRLMRRGRMGLGRESVRERDQLRRILEAAATRPDGAATGEVQA
jgi:heterodisulfide reductase subunit C